jgi:outer membrane receptor protein involved in Fe transport
MRHALLALPLLAAQPAFAEAPPADIVVTGTGLSASAGDAAYDIAVIPRARLANTASGRLEDVLRDVAGFAQFRRSDSRSAHPTSQGATLRGLGGNASSRALVMLDGVPQVDPFGGWVGWAAFEPVRLGSARVTRGGGSGVYGPGALAGTIELSSAGAADLAPVWGELAYGSRDSVEGNLGVAAPLAGGFASLSGGYARGDGFIPIVAEDRGPVDIPARYEQASAQARAVVPVGAETELQANALFLLDRRTRGTAFTPNRNIGADASVRLVGRGHWGWEALVYLQMREFSSGFASINAARTTAIASLDQYNVPATGVGGRIEIRPPLGEGIELRLGGDARRTSGETKERYFFTAGIPANGREAGGQTVTVGAFAELSAALTDALTLTGGGRIDRWTITDGFLDQHALATGATLAGSTAFPNRSGWEPTGRAGLAFKPAESVTLRVAGYLGWRLPTLNELYRPFRVGADSTAANAALRPERLKGVDGGVDFRPLPGLRIGGTVYWNQLDDAIGNVTLSVAPSGAKSLQRQNLDAVRSRGAELDASYESGAWRLAASYAYIDARVRASGVAAALDGLRPAQTAPHQASATLGWQRPDGPGASVTARYLAGQYDDDQNTDRLNAVVTFDATIAMPLAAGFTAELRGENIGNRRVEAGISGAGIVERAAPRTVWIGLRYAAPR